jgi:hypothetical protein
MRAFEIKLNGEKRFAGDFVTAITISVDEVPRTKSERLLIHVGVGGPEDQRIQHLGADLKPGDEITIRVISDEELDQLDEPQPSNCSFCGTSVFEIQSMTSGVGNIGICNLCIKSLTAVLIESEPLPLGASFRDNGDAQCGFCSSSVKDAAGLLVRNGAAICSPCLRMCSDLSWAK